MLEGKRAFVEPRVLSPVCGYAFPLADLVEPYLGRCGVIMIVGPAGSGKTVALRHLAAVLPDELVVIDRNESDAVIEREAQRALVVCVRPDDSRLDLLDTFGMAPWGRDEAMEYLMTVHPRRCGDVMRRLVADSDGFSETCPDIWCAVLDEMASADDIGPLDAFAAAIRAAPVQRWMHHRLTRVLVDGLQIAMYVLGLDPDAPPRYPDAATRTEAIRQLARIDDAPATLAARWSSEDAERQPLAASLLVRMDDAWRPDGNSPCCLVDADLEGVQWRGVVLPGARCSGANLDGADLESARFDAATFDGAQMNGCRLRNARAARASFVHASLAHADLTAACMESAVFHDADLRDARLVRADLSYARLPNARVDGADFSRADLSFANLRCVDLRRAQWQGTRFEGALMDGCHLEGLALPGASFERASLTRAHLTASAMQGASFRGANLEGALLGEVSWEDVDLRNADLSRANFHMGSSREGLVDSVVPCEGSRTGYYTDEYDEQSFKAPEEIRKANLCRADLRGAIISRTDFYLVDLRGARYDRAQAVHFRRCGAILHAKRM